MFKAILSFFRSFFMSKNKQQRTGTPGTQKSISQPLRISPQTKTLLFSKIFGELSKIGEEIDEYFVGCSKNTSNLFDCVISFSAKLSEIEQKISEIEKSINVLRKRVESDAETMSLLRGKYREGIKKDVIKSVARLIENLETTERNLGDQFSEKAKADVDTNLTAFLADLGVVRYPKTPDEITGKKIDFAHAISVGTILTSNPELDNRVAEVWQRGVIREAESETEKSETLVPAKVKIYKYDASKSSPESAVPVVGSESSEPVADSNSETEKNQQN